MATWDDVLEIGARLPETEQATSYGTPALKIGRRLIARLREDGKTIVVRVDQSERELLMTSDPDKFYITPHYQNYPAVLVRLERIDRVELAEMLTEAWLMRAPKRLRAAHEARLVEELSR
jgi:hypothetical protein